MFTSYSIEKEKAALLFRRQLVLLTNLLKLLYGMFLL